MWRGSRHEPVPNLLQEITCPQMRGCGRLCGGCLEPCRRPVDCPHLPCRRANPGGSMRLAPREALRPFQPTVLGVHELAVLSSGNFSLANVVLSMARLRPGRVWPRRRSASERERCRRYRCARRQSGRPTSLPRLLYVRASPALPLVDQRAMALTVMPDVAVMRTWGSKRPVKREPGPGESERPSRCEALHIKLKQG